MSKRRINKQQASRMKRLQDQRLEDHASETSKTSRKGLVLARFANRAEIEDETGQHFLCSIKPELRTLVCGDQVLFEPEGTNQGMVSSIFPRTSLLIRNRFKEKKPVAANVTQLIITLAPKPAISWSLLDSYLIIAENMAIHPLIILNKTDLPCEDVTAILENSYRPLGYDLLYMQKDNPDCLKNLSHALKDTVSIFVGQSGVGKSSLIAGLLPHETIATAPIAELAELGKHTTSNTRYYHLPEGGALIDSPGVRAFSLGDMQSTDIAQGYREFRPFIARCKFRNCTHHDSPGCAIVKAVQDGDIAVLRYENFLSLQSSTGG